MDEVKASLTTRPVTARKKDPMEGDTELKVKVSKRVKVALMIERMRTGRSASNIVEEAIRSILTNQDVVIRDGRRKGKGPGHVHSLVLGRDGEWYPGCRGIPEDQIGEGKNACPECFPGLYKGTQG